MFRTWRDPCRKQIHVFYVFPKTNFDYPMEIISNYIDDLEPNDKTHVKLSTMV